jgi:hypothetical protein
MANQWNFEIIRKSIMTAHQLLPRPRLVLDIFAAVRCPDQSELLISKTIYDQPMTPEEIDAKILDLAQQVYESGGASFTQ